MRKLIASLIVAASLASLPARAEPLDLVAARPEGARREAAGKTLLYLATGHAALSIALLTLWLLPPQPFDHGEGYVVRQNLSGIGFALSSTAGATLTAVGVPLYVSGRRRTRVSASAGGLQVQW